MEGKWDRKNRRNWRKEGLGGGADEATTVQILKNYKMMDEQFLIQLWHLSILGFEGTREEDKFSVKHQHLRKKKAQMVQKWGIGESL